MSLLPVISMSGGPEQRGRIYGEQAGERIRDTFAFYFEAIFKNSALSQDEIERRATRVKSLINDYAPEYCVEIKAMAQAADIEEWKIYVLNARTEILNAPIAECTSLYFEQTRILGQTWDWIKELEALMVILRYEMDDGHVITTLSEPGMLAKIGMNNAGLGVCLNFLSSTNELNGVPVHIVLRAILDCRDINTARQRIAESGKGKSSHFLVADLDGQSFGMEFANGQCGELAAENGVLMHTNHCVAPGMDSTMLPTSAERLAMAKQQSRELNAYRLADMQAILLDDSQGTNSIQAPYHPEEVLGGLDVGSCATVIMDLAKNNFYIKKGPGASSDFESMACEV